MSPEVNSKSHASKRLSWNMSISGASSALEDSPIMSPRSWTTHESSCSSPTPSLRPQFSNRKAAYPRSLQSTTEQEREIQKWLSALARTENSRLSESIENSLSSNHDSRDESTNGSAGNQARSLSTHPTHNRHCSMPALRRRPVSSQFPNNLHIYRESLASPEPSQNCVSHLDFALPVERSRPFKSKSDGLYILTSRDFELLEKAVQGPNRPGNIRGTALSWVMTADVVRAGISALSSPERLAEFAQFMWATFSDPQLVLPGSMDFTFLPPHQLVVSLQPSRARITKILDRLQHTIVHLLCSGFSVAVITLQLALLGFMVIAYFVGGILVIPIAHLHPSLQLLTMQDQVLTARPERRGLRKIRRAKMLSSN